MTREERRELALSYLGRTVTLAIDRPAGYVHRKERYTLTYPLNYGYIPGVLGGDGEELDVYLLGPTRPLDTFTGRIVGIIWREDDREDKLVAAPLDARPDQGEIGAAVAFQEQYYHTRIQALYPRSCGAILWRGDRFLLLRQHRSGTWSFPKGHREPGETPRQTAVRETREETGLTVELAEDFEAEATYPLPRISGSLKTVTLFLAAAPVPQGQVLAREEQEIAEIRWVTAQEAAQLLSPAYGPALRAAESYIKGKMSPEK